MLTGDAQAAEDLLQTALARVWPKWSKVADGNPFGYVLKTMVRTNASWRARRWNFEAPTADLLRVSSSGDTSDEHGLTDERIQLQAALAGLPTRQRQAIVLRYFNDLSVESVAELMGTSPGTVKSQCAKGLSKLRGMLDAEELEADLR
jgi:RNA polymerase sigma-70 factor (sigma-E family)